MRKNRPNGSATSPVFSYPTSGSETVSSNVFISSALDKILQYKEARKNTVLKEAIASAKGNGHAKKVFSLAIYTALFC
jgi:hypothetical protein